MIRRAAWVGDEVIIPSKRQGRRRSTSQRCRWQIKKGAENVDRYGGGKAIFGTQVCGSVDRGGGAKVSFRSRRVAGTRGRKGEGRLERVYLSAVHSKRCVQGNTLLLFPSRVVRNFSRPPRCPTPVLLYILLPCARFMQPALFSPLPRALSLSPSIYLRRVAWVRFVPRERENVNGIAD